jgi:uncharacterized protein YggU (UPF0235/DUF167 family)
VTLPAPCYRVEAGAVVLAVRLTPRAARDEIDGVGALSDGRAVAQIRVRALPAGGAANAALDRQLENTFRAPKTAETIIDGHTARLKQVKVAGDTARLIEAIEKWPRSA